jgi:hypothetical protein
VVINLESTISARNLGGRRMVSTSSGGKVRSKISSQNVSPAGQHYFSITTVDAKTAAFYSRVHFFPAL